MPSVIVLSEGLTERRENWIGSLPVSGDGVAMAVAASLLNPALAQVIGRQPAHVGMFSAVGDDEGGASILECLREHDVDTSLVATMPLLPDEAGNRCRNGTASWGYEEHDGPAQSRDLKYYNREAKDCPMDRLFREAGREVTVFRERAAAGAVLLVSGIAVSRPFGEATFASMLDEISSAKGRGVQIVVDLNTRLRLFKNAEHAEERLTALMKLADVATPSWPADISQLGQAVFPWGREEEVEEGIHALGVPHVILKLEARGSTFSGSDGRRLAVPSRVVEKPNPTGTGDTYAGALALGICQGCSMEQSMKLATLAAIGKLRTPGKAILGREYVPSVEEIGDICSLT